MSYASYLLEPQPPPLGTDTPAVWPLIIAQLKASPEHRFQVLAWLGEQRNEQGRQRYGVPLQVENGREPLVDALQEALDAMAYTRQHFERVRTPAAMSLHQQTITLALAVIEEWASAGAGEIRTCAQCGEWAMLCQCPSPERP